MTTEEFFWLVGLLEGEGTFLPGPPSNPNSPRIALLMTDKDIVQKVARLWGMSFHEASSAQIKSKGWTLPYKTTLRGTKAVALMKLLQPYLGIRRQVQVTKALRNYDPNLRKLNSSKLTEALVTTIRHESGSIREIARRYGVSHATISRIKSKETWSWL